MVCVLNGFVAAAVCFACVSDHAGRIIAAMAAAAGMLIVPTAVM